jgi:hypothetical protein
VLPLRSTVTQEHAPKVPADQLTLDRTLKRLRKLRWIGQDQEAQNMLQILNDTRLQPSLLGVLLMWFAGDVVVATLAWFLVSFTAVRLTEGTIPA